MYRYLLLSLAFSTFVGSLHGQKWEKISLVDVNGVFIKASSELPYPNDSDWINRRYGVANLIDANYETAWSEGVQGSGVGQSVILSFQPDCRVLNIVNGYGKSTPIFQQNNRVKKLECTYYIGISPEGWVSDAGYTFLARPLPRISLLDLKNSDSLQSFRLMYEQDKIVEFTDLVENDYTNEFSEPIGIVATFVKLEITEVYQGSKYDDTCISEIFFGNTFIPDYRNQIYSRVDSVYVDPNNESQILIDTPNKKGISLLQNVETVFQLIETTADNKWAIVIRMPAEVDAGRVETEYLLLNTFIGKDMNYEIEQTAGISLWGPFFFSLDGKRVFLEHAEGSLELH